MWHVWRLHFSLEVCPPRLSVVWETAYIHNGACGVPECTGCSIGLFNTVCCNIFSIHQMLHVCVIFKTIDPRQTGRHLRHVGIPMVHFGYTTYLGEMVLFRNEWTSTNGCLCASVSFYVAFAFAFEHRCDVDKAIYVSRLLSQLRQTSLYYLSSLFCNLFVTTYVFVYLFKSIFCVTIVYLAESLQVYEHGWIRVTMVLRSPSNIACIAVVCCAHASTSRHQSCFTPIYCVTSAWCPRRRPSVC